MEQLRYDRLYRTASSESYLVSVGEQPLARLELHYGKAIVYGLLVFEQEPSPTDVQAVITHVDEDLVCTAGTARDNFVVTVYTGRELAVVDDATRAAAERRQD